MIILAIKHIQNNILYTVIETSNYKGLTATDNFVIEKQTVTEPTIESKVYSGSNQVQLQIN